jgi:hypothetical protein
MANLIKIYPIFHITGYRHDKPDPLSELFAYGMPEPDGGFWLDIDAIKDESDQPGTADES